MIRLVVDNGASSIAAAWDDFDGAAIELLAMFCDPLGNSVEARRELAFDAARAWTLFSDLVAKTDEAAPADNDDDDSRPAA